MKVLSSKQSKELEKRAVQSGFSYLQLMENAGTAAADYIHNNFSIKGKSIVILCGKGNNGGDGFVCARHFSVWGAKVTVIIAESLPVTDIAEHMFIQMREHAVKIINYNRNISKCCSIITNADFIIDAVYGTGFHGNVNQSLQPLFRAANKASAIVLSLDIPSGANCNTGLVDEECINADYTITFSTLKFGHLIYPSKLYCGKVITVSIGIQNKIIEIQNSDLETVELSNIKYLLKKRNPESNKGNYGKLLCFCGSDGMAGAAVMSSKAAVRCGAGIVNVAVPRSIYPIVASNVIEPIYTILDFTQDCKLQKESRSQLLKSLFKSSACLIGCGLGTKEDISDLVFDTISCSKVPLIIDADGINIIAKNINILKTVSVPVVLTPHPGEMARLLNTTVNDVQTNRLKYAKNFASEYNVILVLKGSGTIIASPDGTCYINTTGNAGMAKGGSGDVLAGMISSFIAQGNDPLISSAGAVYLHGAAGDLCKKELSEYAMLPTDLINMLPRLFLNLSNN